MRSATTLTGISHELLGGVLLRLYACIRWWVDGGKWILERAAAAALAALPTPPLNPNDRVPSSRPGRYVLGSPRANGGRRGRPSLPSLPSSPLPRCRALPGDSPLAWQTRDKTPSAATHQSLVEGCRSRAALPHPDQEWGGLCCSGASRPC